MSVSVLLFLAIVLAAPPPLVISVVFLWDVFAQPSHGQAQVPQGSVAMQFVAEDEVLILEDEIDFSDGLDTNGLRSFHGKMSASDAALFAEFTDRHVTEKVKFIACDVTIMEPIVQTRVSDGRFIVVGQDANRILFNYIENGCP